MGTYIMKVMKDIKQSVVSYGMHSPYVRQLVKTWASRNKVISHYWLQLVSAILGHSPQLPWKSFWREKAKIPEHQGRGVEASQDEILGDGPSADLDSQATYNEYILSLYCAAALNA